MLESIKKWCFKIPENATKTSQIEKGFLITGETEEARQQKLSQLLYEERFLISSEYKGEDEIAVLFSAHRSDFDDMTFEKAKTLVGSQELGCDFKLYPFAPAFGIINVKGIKKTSTNR